MRTLETRTTDEAELDRILSARGIRRIARFAPGPGGGKSTTFPQLLETLEDRIPGIRTIAVAGCGGTAAPPRIAEGIATAAAREGRRTVIVDADLYEPRQHLLWNGPDAAMGPGVRQILEEGLPASPDAFHPTKLANTRLVPAGEPSLRDAGELLSGKIIERWIQVHLPAMADLVVVSAPRIEEGAATDVARHADALVVVLDPDRFDPVALEGALERIAAAGVVVAGLVVVPTGGATSAPIPTRGPAVAEIASHVDPAMDAGILKKDPPMNAEPNPTDNGQNSNEVEIVAPTVAGAPRPAGGADNLSDLLGNWRRREYSAPESRSRGSEDSDRPIAEPAWNPLPTEIAATQVPTPEPIPEVVAEAIARIDAAEVSGEPALAGAAPVFGVAAVPGFDAETPAVPAALESTAIDAPLPSTPRESFDDVSVPAEPAVAAVQASTEDAPVVAATVEPAAEPVSEPSASAAIVVEPEPIVVEVPRSMELGATAHEVVHYPQADTSHGEPKPIPASSIEPARPAETGAGTLQPAVAAATMPASFEWVAGEPGRVALRVEVGLPVATGQSVPVVAELSVAADRLRGMKGTCPGSKVVLDADVSAGADDSRLRLWTGLERSVALDVAFEAGSGFRFQSGSGPDAPKVSFEAGADGRSVFRAVSTLLQAELSRTPGTEGGNAVWSFQLTLAPAT